MKQLLNYNPLFDPVAKTLDFGGMNSSFAIDKLYAVINVTRNTPLYIPGAAGYGITAINGSKITLTFDTSTHRSSDLINVFYDTAGTFDANAAFENGGQLQLLQETMTLVLSELRVTNMLLASGLNIDYNDAVVYRNDLTTTNNN
jgi:hypothetical protein